VSLGRPGRAAVAVLAVAVAFALVGCGAGGGDPERGEPDGSRSGSAATGRPLSSDEAQLLADTLTRNLEGGGASFTAAFTVDGGDVEVTGDVDWAGHAGAAQVRIGAAPPYEVRWTADAVLQALPGTRERLTALGRPGVEWFVHPADPAGRRLDALVAVLIGLAATTPDNPVNLRQRDDVDVLGSATVDGQPVVRIRSGDLVLWIGRGDGRLRRLEAPLAFVDGPARIDLRDPRPVTVELPARATVAEAEAFPDVYAELTSVGVL
jgi:hypothetical protein